MITKLFLPLIIALSMGQNAFGELPDGGIEKAPEGVKFLSQTLERGEQDVRIVFEPIALNGRERRVAITLSDGKLKFGPAVENKYVPPILIDLQNRKETAAMVALLGGYSKWSRLRLQGQADSGENKEWQSTMKTYVGKFGNVAAVRCEQLSEQIDFQNGSGEIISVPEPRVLSHALETLNPHSFSQLRQSVRTETQKQAVATELAEKATREQAIATAKARSDERLKAFEAEQRKKIAATEDRAKVAEIAQAESDAKIEILNRLQIEAKQKLESYLGTNEGRALWDEIMTVQQQIQNERNRRRAALREKLEPLAEQEKTLLALVLTASRPEARRINNLIIANQQKKNALIGSFGDLNTTSQDSRLLQLREQFERRTGYKYEAALKLMEEPKEAGKGKPTSLKESEEELNRAFAQAQVLGTPEAEQAFEKAKARHAEILKQAGTPQK